MPRIELEHVTKRWGKSTAVKDLSMVINDREFITLLGPSGCGKTTTLRMIAGLETPTEGKITIGETVVFDSEKGINVSPAKRDIGFLFQNYALWPHMTVWKNITFGLENLKWKKEDIINRANEVMKLLKIEEYRDRYPSELSGGQQQRVAIARTLAPNPKVLFMDEPLSNLDAKLRGEMRTELKRLHMDTNSTFVYVTHDQLEAMTLATRICLISAGVLQQYDPPLTVYNKPSNLFVADFVGNPTMNFIPAKCHRIDDKTLSLDIHGVKSKYVASQPFTLSNESTALSYKYKGSDGLEKALVLLPSVKEKPEEDIYAVEEKKEENTTKISIPNQYVGIWDLEAEKAEDNIEVEISEDKIKVNKKNISEIIVNQNSISFKNVETEVIIQLITNKPETSDVVIGVRPEFLPIHDNGKIEGVAYSTLPAGMETTVKIMLNDVLLSSVVFGSIDYLADAKIRFDISGNGIILFDARTKKNVALGKVEVE